MGTELRHERYFDSHPRVGGDFTPDSGSPNEDIISIRTPAWWVTVRRAQKRSISYISIRTPAWGVTDTLLCPSYGCTFQFAPPRGG